MELITRMGISDCDYTPFSSIGGEFAEMMGMTIAKLKQSLNELIHRD
jgi:hypothetical protein